MDLSLYSQLNGLRQSIVQVREALSPDIPDEDIAYHNGLESSL